MSDIIIADVDTISELSGAFGGFKTDIETATSKLSNVAIIAGNFTDAKELETTVKTRTEELTANLKGLSDALDSISGSLETIAGKYQSTADQNSMTAQNVQELIDGIDKYLPGFK
jgi:methyl-accepting chemotaxis protein